MPKYRVKASHIHSGGVSVLVGDAIELSKQEGEHRERLGFVEPWLEPEQPAKSAKAEK